MAGPFYYDPGVQDRRGELLGRGIETAGESLAEGIKKAKQKHDENKAYGALADVLGLDKNHRTKLDVQMAVTRDTILQGRQQYQQKQQDRVRQQQARAAAVGVLGSLLGRRQSQFAPGAGVGAVMPSGPGGGPVALPGQAPINQFLPDLIMPGQNPIATGLADRTQPGQPGKDAMLDAFADNPEALNDPNAQDWLKDAIKQQLAQPKAWTYQPDFGGSGRGAAVQAGGTGFRFEPNPPAAAKPGAERNLPPELEEDEAWEQMTTKAGKTIPGYYYAVDKGGKPTGKRWYDPQSATRGTDEGWWNAGSAGGAPGAKTNDPLGLELQ